MYHSNIVLKYNPIENIDDSNNKKETLSAGAKAGIAIAVIVIVCMIVGFFIWYFVSFIHILLLFQLLRS